MFPNDLERGDVGRHGHHFDRPIFVKRKGGSPLRWASARLAMSHFGPLLQVVRGMDCVFAVRVRLTPFHFRLVNYVTFVAERHEIFELPGLIWLSVRSREQCVAAKNGFKRDRYSLGRVALG